MVKHNIRTFGLAILWLAFIVYILIFLCTQDLKDIDLNKALAHISTTISINIFLWTIFVSWAWKLKVFYPWLVAFPNLSGEWTGYIKSNWKEKQLDQIPITVSIVQNFFHIQIRIRTNESRSYSIGASFDIDKERGFQQLFYTYLNTPKAGVRERSEIHYGSTILNFNGFKITAMDGEYWTDRETTGEIVLSKNADQA